MNKTSVKFLGHKVWDMSKKYSESKLYLIFKSLHRRFGLSVSPQIKIFFASEEGMYGGF